MYSFILPSATNPGKVFLFGGRWPLTLCRACSTVCVKTSYVKRSSPGLLKDHTHFPPSSHHLSFQTSLYKSKYLIHRELHTPAPLNHNFSRHFSHKRHDVLSYTPSLHSLVLSHRLSSQIISIQSRHFQTSLQWLKEESKVEKTVKALKDSAKEASGKEVAPKVEETKLVPAKKTLTQRLVATVKHYYHGFRLLFIDMKICCKLIWSVLNGHSLSRREYNQLVRTTADMFRLLPMLVFILVPFAEFLLPVVLHLFPNMLPSTFKEEKDEKELVKKKLKAKIEMAKFLQKTIKESAVEAKKKDGHTAESFAMFLDQIRDDGVKPNTKDIMKFAKLFEDEITLDNLTRQQLRACCIMLNITPIGSDALLRFLLQMKLRGLMADDKMIQKEGIESLTISELQSANRARGMRALGMSEERLRDQLRQWLQLHLEEKIPTSLLLLSRALYLPETLSQEEKLGATITRLADTAAGEAKIMVAEMSGEKVDNKTKLEIIKKEEEIIAAEKEAQEREAKLLEQAEREQAEALAAETAMESNLELDDTARTLEVSPDEVLIDTAQAIQPHQGEMIQDKAEEFTAEDLDEMETVLEEVAKARKINIEGDALKGLKDDVTEYKEDLEDLKDVAVVCGAEEKAFAESKAAKRLAKKVEKMITRLDKVVDSLQEEKSHIQEKMSIEEDSLKREMHLKDELGGETEHLKEQIDLYNRTLAKIEEEEVKIHEFKVNIININEMLDALKRLKKIPTESKLTRIFEVLDTDKDGNIDINLALKVLEILSQEHLKLGETQVKEVISLLKHEAKLEEEERQREKEEKQRQKEEEEKQKLKRQEEELQQEEPVRKEKKN